MLLPHTRVAFIPTCRASAAILNDGFTTAVWLAASTPEPLLLGCRNQKWNACLHLLDNTSYRGSARELGGALSLAAQAGQLELVQVLLKQGAWGHWDAAPFQAYAPLGHRLAGYLFSGQDKCYQSYGGSSHPLVSAAAGGQLATCALLLQQQPLPHLDRLVEGTALRKAAEKGDAPMIQLLIDGLPRVGRPHSWRDSFAAAVRAGQTGAVSFFLERGASTQEWCLRLVDAVEGGSLETLQLLLDLPNQGWALQNGRQHWCGQSGQTMWEHTSCC
jgi:hypothetical protein